MLETTDGFHMKKKVQKKTHVSDRVSQAFCHVTSKLGIDMCVTSKPVFAKGEPDIKSQLNKTSGCFTISQLCKSLDLLPS